MYIRPPAGMLDVAEVAAYLNVTARRVRQLDDVLRPMRGTRGLRWYSPDAVAAYAAARDAERSRR